MSNVRIRKAKSFVLSAGTWVSESGRHIVQQRDNGVPDILLHDVVQNTSRLVCFGCRPSVGGDSPLRDGSRYLNDATHGPGDVWKWQRLWVDGTSVYTPLVRTIEHFLDALMYRLLYVQDI